MAPSPAAKGTKSSHFSNTGSGVSSSKKKVETVEISDSDDDMTPPPKPKAKSTPKSSAAAKRKVEVSDSDEYDESPPKKSSAKKQAVSDAKGKPAAKKTPTKQTKGKGKAEPEDENDELPPPADGTPAGMGIEDAILRFAPADFGSEETSKKWKPGQQSSGPVAAGSKELPQGKPNCLAPYNIVFTGELSSISRDEARDLAKRYGAKVTGAPSSKTTHVVMGANAGASKLKTLRDKKFKCRILDEDGFFDLIRGSKGVLDDKQKEKIAKEEKAIQKAAEEMKKEVTSKKATDGGYKLGAVISGAGSARTGEDTSGATLWTTKYAPRKMKDLVGNKGAIEKLKNWLEAYPKSRESNFKKPGKDASGTFRAVLLSGSPGIGKTSAAHLISRLLGYTPVELNASDVRSKKLIELALKDAINNTNLDRWYHDKEPVFGVDGVRITNKTVLIMDEVDGMGGGDRGGVGAVNALIKKTKVPIICICNDRRNPKMKPFESTCFSIPFRKPESQAIKSRMLTVAFSENMKIPQEVMLSLVESSQGDVRMMLNMLSTWALSQRTMDFDESKALGEANAKPGIYTPFTLYSELSSPYMFSPTCRKTLNDKADFYFQDPMFMPLMVHENYLRQRPNRVTDSGPIRALKLIQTFAKAAEAISDGDVIDSMIHGPQQHWSLMPIHAIASCVRPCSYIYGPGAGFPSFPAWLGHNSKQQKLRRANVDIQARMRLCASGSAQEIRLTYQPVLFERLLKPLTEKGAGNDEVAEVIATMDEYYLGLEDRDAIIELGVGKNDGETLLKKVPSALKSSFTRTYNKSNHPVAFYKVMDVSLIKAKQLKGEPAPDVEEAYDNEDDVVPDDVDEDKKGDEEEEGEIELSKNKLVKEKKQPAASAAKGKGKAPAATKGKAAASGKAGNNSETPSPAKPASDKQTKLTFGRR